MSRWRGMSVALAAAAGCVAAVGCGPPLRRATAAQLRYRAAFDLGCSPRRMALYSVAARTVAVTGCGRRLVYLEQCDAATGECSYRLDTPSVAQLGWPQAWAGRAQPGLPAGDWSSRAASPRAMPTTLFEPGERPPVTGRRMPSSLFDPAGVPPAASAAAPRAGAPELAPLWPWPAGAKAGTAATAPAAQPTPTAPARSAPSSTIIRDLGF